MRKKDLLALPLMKVTEEMRRAAGETQKYERWRMTDVVGPKYQKYFRARKTGSVLEITVFEWGRIQAGDDEPIFRIFLHDGKYNTWDAYKQKWRTASIEHLYDSEYQTRAERAAHGTYWYKERDRQEQRAKIEKTRADIQRMQPEPVPEKEYKGIPATMVAPVFAPVLFDIKEKRHTEYVFPGGRGSTKSSFVSLAVGDILRSNDQIHAVIMRQVGDTMRSSIYQQARWAIEALGLEDEFECTVSPLEITRKSTGQKIYFRGADDPGKVKSIKVPFGYIGVLWFEELDQFMGPEAVRKIEQSVIRGGDTAYIFKTFNPPKSLNNWANKYIKIPKETRLVTESTYLDIPKKWLGKTFIEEAEFLKETNPDAYENEYLGVANGSGGSVFDNITIREITDDEISGFDHVLNGIDWGWFPDPYAFARVHYDRARLRLYVWQEYTCNKRSNRQTADELIRMGITGNDLLTCDSAEKKSIGDYKSYGLLARAAEKGPGSREYSYKWLQSLREIIIDNVRCPVAAQEFMDYEYERDKEGNIITGYPDGNDHMIDAVRYATERIWKRRGE